MLMEENQKNTKHILLQTVPAPVHLWTSPKDAVNHLV